MKDDNRRFRSLVFAGLIVPLILLMFLYLIWSLRPLLLPIIIGVLLAYLCRPLKTAFRYRWLPNGFRLTLLFALFLGGLFGTILFVKNNIPKEKEKLELLVRMKFKLNKKMDQMMAIDPKTGKGNFFYEMVSDDLIPLRAQINAVLSLSPEQVVLFEKYYQGYNGEEKISEKYHQYFLENSKTRPQLQSPSMPSTIESNKIEEKNEVNSTSSSPAVGHESQSLLKTLMNLASIWILLPVAFFFFLIDDGEMAQFFIRLVPNRYFELGLTVLEAVDGAIGKYLRGLSMECGLVGASLALGLFVIGAAPKVSILIGLLAAFATAIPLVGPVMGLGLSLAYAIVAEEIHPLIPMINLDNLVVAVLIVVAIVFALDNLVFQPVVLGSAVNLHPLVVILGIMGGSMLFGLAGVLLAVPAIVIIKTILQYTFRGLKDYRII